jgi:lysozyme family protein
MTIDRNVLLEAIQALVERRDATTDQQEKQKLEAEITHLDRTVTRLALDSLQVASQRVASAADNVEAILATAHVNPFDRTLDASVRKLADAAIKLSNEASKAFAFEGSRAVDTPDADDDIDVAEGGAGEATSIAGAAPAADAAERSASRAPARSSSTSSGSDLPPIVAARKFEQLAHDYELCWNACAIHAERRAEVDRAVERLRRGEQRYRAVSAKTHVPWQLIGLMHGLECGYDFNKHLHNGDSLGGPTVRVPAGRPHGWAAGAAWEDSAIDALKLKKFDRVGDWSLPRVLYALEAFNGFGYRGHGVRSPYLWSFSNLYDKGKYVADHQFDPDAVSKQIGSAVLLKRLEEEGLWP